jgi:hypothetical protein
MKTEIGYLYRVGADMAEEVKPANGKKFSLQELQKFVGGYIEYVPLSRPIAYCNEEGTTYASTLQRPSLATIPAATGG